MVLSEHGKDEGEGRGEQRLGGRRGGKGHLGPFAQWVGGHTAEPHDAHACYSSCCAGLHGFRLYTANGNGIEFGGGWFEAAASIDSYRVMKRGMRN